MKKFKEQLEEKTQMLRADIRSQQDALEMIKEQLQRMQDSNFQVRSPFYISKWQKGEGKRDLDCFQAVSHQGLLVGTAALQGGMGHLELSSAGTYGCALCLLAVVAEMGPASLWWWQTGLLYSQGFPGDLSCSMPSMSCALRKGAASE